MPVLFRNKLRNQEIGQIGSRERITEKYILRPLRIEEPLELKSGLSKARGKNRVFQIVFKAARETCRPFRPPEIGIRKHKLRALIQRAI